MASGAETQRRAIAVRNFDNAGACSQSIDQGIGLRLVRRVEIGVPFVKQIDFRIGCVDDFFQ